jgi:hypothetical protein
MCRLHADVKPPVNVASERSPASFSQEKRLTIRQEAHTLSLSMPLRASVWCPGSSAVRQWLELYTGRGVGSAFPVRSLFPTTDGLYEVLHSSTDDCPVLPTTVECSERPFTCPRAGRRENPTGDTQHKRMCAAPRFSYCTHRGVSGPRNGIASLFSSLGSAGYTHTQLDGSRLRFSTRLSLPTDDHDRDPSLYITAIGQRELKPARFRSFEPRWFFYVDANQLPLTMGPLKS